MKKMVRQVANALGFDVTRLARSPISQIRDISTRADISVQTIVDVGANVGQSAASFASMFPGASIWCFEPCPEAYNELVRNCQRMANVCAIEQALADHAGKRVLHVGSHSDLSSLLPPIASHESSEKHGLPSETRGDVHVDVSTLDEFIADSGLRRIDILKIDIEGGELLCLQGARQALASSSIALIMLEVSFAPRVAGEPLFWDLATFLTGFDYRFFDFLRLKKAAGGRLRIADALFVSPSIRDTSRLEDGPSHVVSADLQGAG